MEGPECHTAFVPRSPRPEEALSAPGRESDALSLSWLNYYTRRTTMALRWRQVRRKTWTAGARASEEEGSVLDPCY